jgi:hypothetical protein
MANEIAELLRRDRKRDMDLREDLEQFFIFFYFYKIGEIKWQNNTGQSVLKSKGFYRTGGNFTGLVRQYFVFTVFRTYTWSVYFQRFDQTTNGIK